MSSEVTRSGETSAGTRPWALTEEDIRNLKEAESVFTDPEDGSREELSIDRTFELLKNQRRRRVLRRLMENGGRSTTGELAEHVATLENDKDSPRALTSKERKAVYVGLYQCHLPKMDDYGVIEFNQARGRIELTDLAYELEEYLYPPEPSFQWPVVYLSVALVGGVTIVSSAFLNLTAVTLVGTLGLIGLVVTVALAQLYVDRH